MCGHYVSEYVSCTLADADVLKAYLHGGEVVSTLWLTSTQLRGDRA